MMDVHIYLTLNFKLAERYILFLESKNFIRLTGKCTY